MDSFCDVPRRAPIPTPVEKFLSAPVVPEVSMLCPTKAPVNNFMPYHTWKMQQNPTGNILTSNRENVIRGPSNRSASPQNTSQLLKKQVRFESPILQQRPSLGYEPFNPRKGLTKCNDRLQIGVKQNALPLNGKTFEEMYMANVPTRQLDLSLIELPNALKKVSTPPAILEERQCEVRVDLTDEIDKNKENELPKTYKEFLETQKKVSKENKADANDSVTDIFNYKRNKNFKCNTNDLEVRKVSNEYSFNKAKSCGESDVISKVIPQRFNSSARKPDICFQNSAKASVAHKPRELLCNNPQCTPTVGCASTSPVPKSNTETQTSLVSASSTNVAVSGDSEVTNKDLLKIIAQQNEQLLILQKQVAMLLNRDQTRQIEAGDDEKYVTSTQNEHFKAQDVPNTPRKRGVSKFSIDLMTSFEVAVRPQHNKQNFVNYEPKIQEITESESVSSDRNDKTVVDNSLHLREPVRVREMCPSPEPSININMNDYDSSEDDEVTASEIGATFYHNLMGQVNDILKKAQVQTKEELAFAHDKTKNKMMSRVKEATMKHLKNIGVTIGPMDITDDSSGSGNDSKDYSPTELSFAVKQILMKYLPDDELAKITYKSAPVRREDKPRINQVRPEFSFASVEYMKKYNLIPNNDTKPRDVEAPKPVHKQKPEGPKILDITALKMQPKLL